MKDLFHFFILSLLIFNFHLAHGGFSSEAPDMTVTVTNFDKHSIFLKDKSGNLYRYPRKDFAVEKFKMHQSFLLHKKSLLKYKVKKPAPKKQKPKQSRLHFMQSFHS